MTDDSTWRGSFAIPMTPFDDHDRLDVSVLQAEIEFCLQAGARGLVVPVLVSEFFVLSEAERRQMVEVTVAVAAGRVPVIANCAAVNTPLAVEYARHAEEVGAAAVIAMPPYLQRPDWPTICAYYQAISAAVTLPIWIQNAGAVALSTDQIISLCSQTERLNWIKEEVEPSPRHIGALVERNCPAVHGVMGGAGGRYMLTEHARGSKGVIHACQFTDLIQRIWQLLDACQLAAAGDLFEHLLPGLVLEGLLGMAFAKEIMVRRGIFKNHRLRLQAGPLDNADLAEIDRVWRRLQPYLTWPAA